MLFLSCLGMIKKTFSLEYAQREHRYASTGLTAYLVKKASLELSQELSAGDLPHLLLHCPLICNRTLPGWVLPLLWLFLRPQQTSGTDFYESKLTQINKTKKIINGYYECNAAPWVNLKDQFINLYVPVFHDEKCRQQKNDSSGRDIKVLEIASVSIATTVSCVKNSASAFQIKKCWREALLVTWHCLTPG